MTKVFLVGYVVFGILIVQCKAFFRPILNIKRPIFAKGFGNPKSPDHSAIVGRKRLKKIAAPVIASLGILTHNPEPASAQTASPARSRTRRSTRASRRGSKSALKRKAAIEVEVVQPETQDGTDWAMAGDEEKKSSRYFAKSDTEASRSKRLTEIGLVFILAVAANSIFFDKPASHRRRKSGGHRRRKRTSAAMSEHFERGGDVPLNPFTSRSLTMEKGKLSSMMNKLDQTLNAVKNTPSTKRTEAQLAEEADDDLFDMSDADDAKDTETEVKSSSGGANDFILDDNLVSRKRKTSPSSSLKKFTATRLPAQDDFFADDPDDLFTSAESEGESHFDPTSPAAQQEEAEEQFQKAFDGQYVDPASADDDTPALPKLLEEDGLPKKKGLLGRIFRRGEDGRPTDLEKVLMSDGDTEELQLFKAAVARALLSGVPEDLNPELRAELGGVVSLGDAKALLVRTKEAAGLDEQAAAEAFAGVANCVMVAMVDRAAAVVGRDEEAEEERVDALDAVAETMDGMGELFACVGAGAKINPVVYNGGIKKGRVEKLYYSYAKYAMSLGDMLGALGVGGADKEDVAGADGGDAESAKVDPETKMRRLGQLQQVLGIREKKRADVEGKVMREAMMGMLKGDGPGLGDLGGLLEGLGGAMGGDGQMDPAALEKMMQDMGGLEGLEDMDMKKLMEGMGGDMGGFDPENMDPGELARMSADAMGAVKESLREGAITKADVAELEKMMGGDINELLKMMQGGDVDKAKLRELGPDFQELLGVFKDLARVKNS